MVSLADRYLSAVHKLANLYAAEHDASVPILAHLSCVCVSARDGYSTDRQLYPGGATRQKESWDASHVIFVSSV